MITKIVQRGEQFAEDGANCSVGGVRLDLAVGFPDIFPDKITDKLTKTEMEFLEEVVGYLERNGEFRA